VVMDLIAEADDLGYKYSTNPIASQIGRRKLSIAGKWH
jgi:hypothetical protein